MSSKETWAFELPIVLGHEAAGTVEMVGEGVASVCAGDRIVLSWMPNCGRCDYCITGRPHLCDHPPERSSRSGLWKGDLKLHLFGPVASFAQFTVVPEAGVIPIPREMPLDRASLLGCAVMTGVGAAIHTARVRAGSTVAVFGCGGVGLNVIQGARLAGAGQIIAVDLSPEKLAFARRFGASDVINGAEEDPVEAIRALTAGRGVDYSFEAIGHLGAMEQAYASVRKGGLAVMVGIPPDGARMSFPARLLNGERWLTGSQYGSANLRMDIPRLISLYLSGRLDLDTLITRRYALEEVNEAFAAMGGGQVGRGVIVF